MEIKSTNYSEALKKFTDWIESHEKRLTSDCHCPTQQTIPIQTPTSGTTPTATESAANTTNGQLKAREANHTADSGLNIINEDNETFAISNEINSTTHIHSNNDTQLSSNQTNGIPKDPIGSSTPLHPPAPSMTPTPNGHTNFQNWKNVITYHQNLQTDIEYFGKQLNCELKGHLKLDKSLAKEESDNAAALEARWHKLWLNHLEQLVVVERTRRCPKHNSTLIGKPPSSPANKGMAKVQRRRPISYPNNHAEMFEWDYKYTLSLTGCHKENGSNIDLDSVDEQITKNLTEFGENYELWFGKEDEVASIALHSRPPSVEPAEKPEIAKAVVTSDPNSHEDINCNLLMLTTPSSMFSVDASKCLHSQEKEKGYKWRHMGTFLLIVLALVFSAVYHEPHHIHKSYYHTQPPV